MTPAITTTQRQNLSAQAERVIEERQLHAATAWAYGVPAANRNCVDAVAIITATGDVWLHTCAAWLGDAGRMHHWHTGDPGASATVDDQLRRFQRAGWVELFILNACDCEGDGRVYLNGDECWIVRDHSAKALDAVGILSDEGRLYRLCTCGAGEAV